MTDELSRRTGEISAEKLALLVLRAKRKRAETPGAGRIPRRTDLGPAPLSFAQQRLWVLDRLEPGSTAYNMPSQARLRGALNVDAFERALGEIVRRHESLRTTFAESDAEPVQVVAPSGGFRLAFTDLTGLAEEARRTEERRLIRAERRPYDLERGPLFRAHLVRMGEEEHLLLLDMHHIISDGWSYGIFFRELSALYDAFLAGRPSPLAELPIQLSDFTVWQRAWLQGPVQQEQLTYWRERLAGVPPALELPLDRLRPAVQTHRGELARLDLPTGLAAGLRELARREGTSPFMTLLSVFQLLLSRLSGQDDVVVGSPSAGRGRMEMEELIGLFLNTLVLRTDLSGDPTFRELLGRVRDVVLGAYQYQDIPFERLLEELQPERQLSRTPIFQVLFNFVSLSDLHLELAGLRVEPVPLAQADSKFDFTLYVRELPDTLRLDLVYNADLFEPERMAELQRQLVHLLAQVVAAPETRIGALSLVTPASADLLPDPALPLDDRWHGAVHHAVSRQAPGRLAVSDAQGAAWTYGELESRANRLARFLIAHGVEKGDAVAVWAQRNAPLVEALLGTLKAGAAFLILDPAYPAPRLLDYLRIARPTAWIGVPGAPPPPAEVEEMAASLCRCRVELPASFSEWPDTDPGVPVGSDDAACITFTSGSTGTPKGVVGRHGPLSHFLPWMGERFELGEDDRFGMLSALSHDPLQRDVFTPLWFGARIVVPDAEEMSTPGYLAAWARREGITVLNLTPAMMEVLLDSAEADLPDLRRTFVVGDLLKKTDVERLHRAAANAVCVNIYGSTETQRSISYFVVPRELDRLGKEVLPLGRGVEGCQLLVLNAAGRLAGVGEAGEICFRGPHLARGYLGDEALTAEKFQLGPQGGRIYRTGDLGRYLPDGSVEIVGRADSQVKLRGFRIELGEIEAALERFPGVRECVVIVRERSLGAYLVADAAPQARELRAFLGARLPDYMVPSAFVVLPVLPLTRTGKVDRRALPAPESVGADRETMDPRNPVEEGLARVWAEVLRRERVGIHDNFFELGGDSIRTIQVVARSRKHGIKVAARQIFQHQTIAELAEVAEMAVTRDLPLTPAQRRVPEGAARETVRVFVPPGITVERALAELRARHEALRGEDALRSELLPDGELLLSAHPLAVDGPSWSVLLSDLAALCQSLELPPAGSFSAWALALADEPTPPAEAVPATAGSVTVHFAAAETAVLLREALGAYGNSVEEMLVAALAGALAPSRVVVEVEGLRPEREGLDSTRVVGCLAVPVRIHAEALSRPGDTLKTVKERLRQPPAAADPEATLRWTAPFDLPAPWRAEREPLPPLGGGPLRVDCRLEDGRLRADWTATGARRREDLDRLARGFLEQLRTLVLHCQSPEAGGFTPSDFPVAGLDQMDLDELLAELG